MRDVLARLAADGLLPAERNDAWAVRGVVPAAVVEPVNAEQAAAVLAACSEHGWAVECAGAGGWLRHGRTPARVDVLLTSRRMRGLTEYVPEDVTLGARAGTPIAELDEATRPHGQMAVLDAPAAAGATLGATLATGCAGPLRASFGVPRDQALGIEMVTGDGRVLRFGGRVVKNVAGYDIVRLLVGSHGTLGFITAAHLRLRARPEREVRLVGEADDAAALVDAARSLVDLEPGILEIIAQGPDRVRLVVVFSGNAAAVEDAADRAAKRVDGLRRLPESEDPLARVRSAEAAAEIVAVLRDRSARLGDTLRRAASFVRACGLLAPLLAAHAANGIVRVTGRAGPSTVERFPAALTDARRDRDESEEFAVSVPVPPPNCDIEPWQVDPAALTIMRRLRAAFDPAGVLAPGRYIA